jgi:hypothetical protein
MKFYGEVWDRTNGVCHVCGDTTLSKEPRSWYADHVIPFDRGGNDEDSTNFLPVCHWCNGLRWHNSPETMRRILFVGVIANMLAYQAPFSEHAATIREMRRERLVDNWKRRKEQRSLSRDELKTKAHGLDCQFQIFEEEVRRRVKGQKADRDLWSDVVKEMLHDPSVDERNAYWELARHESPGQVELERKPASQRASEL